MAHGFHPFATPLTVAPAAYADAYLGQQVINTAPDGSNIYTFTDVSIGTADSRRQVVLFFATNSGTAATHTACTANAGGITFTKIVETAAVANNNMHTIWIANVTSGTTLTAPKLTCSAPPIRASMHGYAHGRGSSTSSIAVQVATFNLDVPANGLVLTQATGTAAAAVDAPWTGVTGFSEDWDANQAGNLYSSGGRYVNDAVADTAKTFAPAWTGSPANLRMTGVAFGAQV